MLQRYGLLPLFTNKKTCFLTSVFGHSPFFSPFFVKIMLFPHVGITFSKLSKWLTSVRCKSIHGSEIVLPLCGLQKNKKE